MVGLMAHRGPGAAGFWQAADQRLALGQRPIPDSRTGPARRGTCVLCLDGVIHNKDELRAELVRRGHLFAGDGTAEVVLAAWAQWGEAVVEFLNGPFALALWDGTRRQLFCARDRMGERPLLYAAGDGFFAFASEYRALLALHGIAAEVDPRRLVGLETGPATATLFPAIGRLAPAQSMTVAGHDLTRRSRLYWSGKPTRLGRRQIVAAAAVTLGDLLADCVRSRLRDRQPALGIFLSGGVGAGALLCLARRLAGDDVPIHAFCARFPGTSADEGDHMEALAAVARPLRHDVEPQPKALVAELGHFARAMELPATSPEQYARYCLARAARQAGIGTVLDGRGMDPVLAGDESYFPAYLHGGGQDSPLLHSRYGQALPPARPWTATVAPRWRRRLARWLGQGSDLTFGLAGDLEPAAAPPPLDLHQALRRDVFDGVLAERMSADDRAASAHGVTLCHPFADHRLFEYAQALPADHLMGEAESKRLLRAALAGTVPDMVRLRWRKQGLAPPRVAWLHQGLLSVVEQVVEDPGLSPVWERNWWRNALRRFRGGDTNLAGGLWTVLATEAWRRYFLADIAARHRFEPLL